jgi:acyl-CoA thioesterase-2
LRTDLHTGGAEAAGRRRKGCGVGVQPVGAIGSTLPINAATPGRFTLSDLLSVLDLSGDVPPVPARTLASEHGGVLGAQQLGQQVVLAERMTPGKTVHSLHTLFSRPGDCMEPVWIEVERLATDGSVDALALSFRQDLRALSRANIMLRAPAADFLRIRPTFILPPGPEAGEPVLDHPRMPWEIRTLPPAEDHVRDHWERISGAGADPTVWRALIAHSCELLPLADLAAEQGLGDTTLGVLPGVTALVLSQTVTFFEDLDVRAWHLYRVRTLHAGHGRTGSRIEVFAEDGTLRAEAEVIGLLRATRP